MEHVTVTIKTGATLATILEQLDSWAANRESNASILVTIETQKEQ